MAKQRYVNTRFWNDNYVSNLDPIEKLLFLYFLTNPYTEICGVYEVSLKQIALDTGIDREEMLPKLIKRFERDNKIFYIDGWVYVKNFTKHQNMNPKVEAGIERSYNLIPQAIRDKIDSLSIAYDSLSHSNSNSNSNLNSNPKRKQIAYAETSSAGDDIVEVIESFKEVNPSYKKYFGNTTQRAAVKRMLDEHGKEKLLSIIAYLPKSNASRYAPTITTPVQLEDGLGKLFAWSQREKNKSNVAFA